MSVIDALVVGAATVVWSLVVSFAVMTAIEKFRIGVPPADRERTER